MLARTSYLKWALVQIILMLDDALRLHNLWWVPIPYREPNGGPLWNRIASPIFQWWQEHVCALDLWPDGFTGGLTDRRVRVIGILTDDTRPSAARDRLRVHALPPLDMIGGWIHEDDLIVRIGPYMTEES